MNYEVCDTVMFFHSEDEIWPCSQRECPAIITGLNDDDTVDLTIFPRRADPAFVRSVPRYDISDAEDKPRGRFWDYPLPTASQSAGSGLADE